MTKIRDPIRSRQGKVVAERSATHIAIALLARREHSRKELQRKLAARGVPSEEVDHVLVALAEAGWQDDARFAASLTRVRVESGYGPAYIRAELATHSIPEDVLAVAMSPFDGCWIDRARDLVNRRYGSAQLGDRAFQRRALAFLLRRGFGQADAYAAIRATGRPS